jgi:hypothetical protein
MRPRDQLRLPPLQTNPLALTLRAFLVGLYIFIFIPPLLTSLRSAPGGLLRSGTPGRRFCGNLCRLVDSRPRLGKDIPGRPAIRKLRYVDSLMTRIGQTAPV